MADDDVTSQLLQQIYSKLNDQERQQAEDKIQLFGDLDQVVGLFSSYFQVLGVPGISAIISAAISHQTESPLEMAVLQSLTSKVDELVGLAGATIAEVRMTSLFGWANPAHSDLETVTTEGPNGPHVNAQTFHQNALDFLNASLDDLYWYRPLILERTFTPADLGGTVGIAWYGAYSSPDPPYRVVPPTDTSHVPGFKTVLDPQLALPAVLSAIKSFLAIEQQLDPPGFAQFLSTWRWKIQEVADRVQCIFDSSAVGPDKQPCVSSLVGGIIASRMPTIDEIYDYMAVNATHGRPGFEWNGVYGVIDVYADYPDPVRPPSTASSNLITLFPTDGIETVAGLTSDSYTFQVQIAYWIRDRVTLGVMARQKTLYLACGYDKAWSTLQHLRVLTGQQATEAVDQYKHWSARELINALPGLPPQDPDVVRRSGLSISLVVDRLNNVANGTWTQLPDPPAPTWQIGVGPDQRPWGWQTRPIGFRDRLAAAAL